MIERFGSVEAALEHAAEVEGKRYREALQTQADQVRLSKKLATIACDAPVPLALDTMKRQPPDVEALRALFAELEFSSLLKELLPVAEVKEGNYRDIRSKSELEDYLRDLPPDAALALAIPAAESSAEAEDQKETDAEPVLEQTGLLDLRPATEETHSPAWQQQVALSKSSGEGAVVWLADSAVAARLKTMLEDPELPKTVHDYKAALHHFPDLGIMIRGVRHDPMLYSYLLDPTYSSHSLPEVALRRLNLKLSGNLAEAADITRRLASALRQEVEQQGLTSVYETIDAPLVPVLMRMEEVL